MAEEIRELLLQLFYPDVGVESHESLDQATECPDYAQAREQARQVLEILGPDPRINRRLKVEKGFRRDGGTDITQVPPAITLCVLFVQCVRVLSPRMFKTGAFEKPRQLHPQLAPGLPLQLLDAFRQRFQLGPQPQAT